MRIKGKYLIAIIVLGFFCSCTKSAFDSKDELVSFIKHPSNGYLQNKHVNGIEISLMLRPNDLLVAQEAFEGISTEKLDSIRLKYEKYMYISLNFSKNKRELLSEIPKSKYEFGLLSNQLTYGLQENVHLHSKSNDTIEMVDFIYPKLYGMSENTSIMLVYRKEDIQKKYEHINLTISDLGMQLGEVKFAIPTKIIFDDIKIKF